MPSTAPASRGTSVATRHDSSAMIGSLRACRARSEARRYRAAATGCSTNSMSWSARKSIMSNARADGVHAAFASTRSRFVGAASRNDAHDLHVAISAELHLENRILGRILQLAGASPSLSAIPMVKLDSGASCRHRVPRACAPEAEPLTDNVMKCSADGALRRPVPAQHAIELTSIASSDHASALPSTGANCSSAAIAVATLSP